MRRATLYSSSRRPGGASSAPRADGGNGAAGLRADGSARRADGDAPLETEGARAGGQPAGPANPAPAGSGSAVADDAHGQDAVARRTARPDGIRPRPAPGQAAPVRQAAPGARRRRWPALPARFERAALLGLGALVALGGMALHAALAPPPERITQKDIDEAVQHTLETKPLPSFAARAVEAVRPSVVRVRRLGQPTDSKDAAGKTSLTEIGVGSGVVILDNGVILTNLHVVAGADRIGVVFSDGSESDAVVLSVQPEHDLAVIRARSIPDDLVAATLRSTQGLVPGDAVAAVGFPFGIGPSASAGVVSGLRREYRSPAGERILSNLIQFDAAVNPGNSGGPLVTAEGEVVGIVTGLLNPTDQQVFIGIGFAVPIENAASAVGMSPF